MLVTIAYHRSEGSSSVHSRSSSAAALGPSIPLLAGRRSPSSLDTADDRAKDSGIYQPVETPASPVSRSWNRCRDWSRLWFRCAILRGTLACGMIVASHPPCSLLGHAGPNREDREDVRIATGYQALYPPADLGMGSRSVQEPCRLSLEIDAIRGL